MCNRAGIALLAIFASVLSFDASSSWAAATSSAGVEVSSHFELPAESLDKALRDFALQAKCNISYEPTIVAGLQAPAVNGDFTVSHVLSLLLKGTKLRAVNVNDNTIQILERTRSTSRDAVLVPNAPNAVTGAPTAHAQSKGGAPVAPSSDSQEIQSAGGAIGNDVDKDIQEITVTGTHIRGTKDSPSPVQVYTRADIDATGMITIQQFLQTLPENFGGASENTIDSIAAMSRTNNTVNGSAPNLRGLGAEATLVLINGHRVAPGDTGGDFVDISMIPLAAVERIEIVTDGASAIYGSDAVGGVVNIILRSNFDGAESRALFGAVGTGSMHNVQAAQTVGDSWQTGSALLSYQYSDQTPLSAGSRDYLHSIPLPFDLLPEQVQQSAFANLDQEVVPGIDLHGDAMYSHRATESVYGLDGGAAGNALTETPSVIDSYSASLGAAVALPRQSKLAAVATYSESDTSQQDYATPPADAPLVYVGKAKSALASLDVNLDGVLASLPAGLAHYAVGAQYRRESYGFTYDYPPTDNTFYPSRNVGSGYLELRIPVVGPTTYSHGDPALELTLADRAEHYSDFGSTNNPQIGAIWKPVSGWAIRGTYGTSFKAPLLSELNPIPGQVIPLPGALFTPAPGGTPNTLFIVGGNPNLKPEKATVWTVGLDFKPEDVAGLTAKLTYYDIVFKDEITDAQSNVNVLNVFSEESILGPQIVQRNPPYSLIQQLISLPSYENPYNVNPASIGALVDDRSLNLSTVKTRGLDFATDYKTTLLSSSIDTGVDGTYIFAFENQFSSSAPLTSYLNTSYNPTSLRLRGKGIVSLGALSTGLYMNFVNSYKDTNITPNGHVASWATTDAVVSYQFGSSEAPSNGVSVSFAVTNLTNRNPPYMSNPTGYGITYDGANANALGRFFSLRLQKRW
jgi:outer membrane receptor protein involved in Fe transport